MDNFKNGIVQYSEEHTGKALANFINLAKVTKSKLGEYSSSSRGGKTDIVVSGHQIFDANDNNIMNAPVTVYTPTSSTTIDKSTLFNNTTTLTIKQLLRLYLEKTDTEKVIIEELIDKAVNIDNKKWLIIPLRPKSDCKVTYSDGEIKKNRTLSTVKYLKWRTNKETYRLICEVAFDFEGNNGTKSVRIPLSEYGKSFVPDKVEYWDGINNANRNIIDMTDLGIIKPIEITDGIHSLVVDGTYLYWLHNGIISIVGAWEGNTLDINSETAKALSKSEIFKFLKNNMTLIGGHRNLIAPYKLCSLHVHNVKTAKEKK